MNRSEILKALNEWVGDQILIVEKGNLYYRGVIKNPLFEATTLLPNDKMIEQLKEKSIKDFGKKVEITNGGDFYMLDMDEKNEQ